MSSPTDPGSETPTSSGPDPARQHDGGDRLPNDRWTTTARDNQHTAPDTPTRAILLGSDYAELGKVAVAEVTSTLAIGLSRGRFPKGYPHVDANEDAVFAIADESTAMLAVADGHSGFDAAYAAIRAIADATHNPSGFELEPLVVEAAGAAIEAVRATIPGLESPRDLSETAVTIAAVREHSLVTWTLGDTACFVVTRRRSKSMGSTAGFLTASSDPASIDVQTVALTPDSMVIATSDGVVDFVPRPERLPRSIWDLPARAAVEHLVGAAFAGGAGDNIAVAVLRLA